MPVGPYDHEALCHIAANLRDDDRREVFATQENDDLGNFVRMIGFAAGLPGGVWVHRAKDGEPVAMQGYWRMWPGVCSVWAFGTSRWPEIVLGMTRHSRRVIFPQILREGYHRAECRALRDRADTGRWLPLLGLKPEAVLAGLGRQREDFILYAWVRPWPVPPTSPL